MSRDDLNAVLDSLAVTAFPAEQVVPVALNLLAGALSYSIAFEGVSGFQSIKAIESVIVEKAGVGYALFKALTGDWMTSAIVNLFNRQLNMVDSVREDLARCHLDSDIDISYQYNYIHGGGEEAYFLHFIDITNC